MPTSGRTASPAPRRQLPSAPTIRYLFFGFRVGKVRPAVILRGGPMIRVLVALLFPLLFLLLFLSATTVAPARFGLFLHAEFSGARRFRRGDGVLVGLEIVAIHGPKPLFAVGLSVVLR